MQHIFGLYFNALKKFLNNILMHSPYNTRCD